MPRDRRILAAILAAVLFAAAGGAVRAIGVHHGAPDLIFHPDVAKQAIVARETFHGRPDPRRLYGNDVQRTLYPFGTASLLGMGLRTAARIGLGPALTRGATPEADRWRWAVRLRYLAIGTFVATLVIVLVLLRSRLGALGFLTAALLLVLEPTHAQFSRFGMNDVPLAALLLLLWAVVAVEAERERARLSAGLAIGVLLGVAFGVKYQALLAVLLCGPAWILVWRRDGGGRALGMLLAAGLGAAAGVLLSIPLLRIAPTVFLEGFPEFMAWQANILGTPLPLADKITRNVRWLVGFFAEGSGLLLVGLAWGLLASARPGLPPGRRAAIAGVVLFTVTMMVVLLAGRDAMRANDLLVVLPFWAVLLGLSLATASVPGRLLCGAAAAGAVAIFALATLLDTRTVLHEDTRVRARDWYAASVPARARVLRERYTLPTGRTDLVEEEVRSIASGGAREIVTRGEADFVVTSSFAHERFFDPTSPFFDRDAQAAYTVLERAYVLRAAFADHPLYWLHPTVRVYSRR